MRRCWIRAVFQRIRDARCLPLQGTPEKENPAQGPGKLKVAVTRLSREVGRLIKADPVALSNYAVTNDYEIFGGGFPESVRFGGILGTMDIRKAVLSNVVHFRGLCFQWLVLYDAQENMGYMHRVGNVQWASDWIESEDLISFEVWCADPMIIPDIPISVGQSAVDALLERTTAEELVENPLPEWKPVDWFQAGLPEHIEVHVVRKFTKM